MQEYGLEKQFKYIFSLKQQRNSQQINIIRKYYLKIKFKLNFNFSIRINKWENSCITYRLIL